MRVLKSTASTPQEMTRAKLLSTLFSLGLASVPVGAYAEPALQVVNGDFEFKNQVDGLPKKLSDIKGLTINRFTTSDGAELAYWEAGTGEPLIFIPGWSSSGAGLINVIALLSKSFHVYVMDPRGAGLSENVSYGNNVYRFAADVRELQDHLKIESAYFGGHSMGASVLWGYIDLYGTSRMKKVAFVDEPPAIYNQKDWKEDERVKAGGFVGSPELMISGLTSGLYRPAINKMVADWPRELPSTPAAENSALFARAVNKADMAFTKLVLFDHVMNDWRSVIESKVDIPAAVFSPVDSNRRPSQEWMVSVMPKSKLFLYSDEEGGDHSLLTKNPIKFAKDLTGFFKGEA